MVDRTGCRSSPGAYYEILSNAETWIAAQRAGWHEIPIDIREDLSDSGAAGEDAAQALAVRLRAHDIAVTIARPIEGGDFNQDQQVLGARALRAALASRHPRALRLSLRPSDHPALGPS